MRNNRRLYESIMRDVSKIVKKHLNESDKQEIDDLMFYDALYNFGELTSEDIEDIFGEPLFIDGKEVTGFYTNIGMQNIDSDVYDAVMYSYIKDGKENKSVFHIDMLDDEQLEFIYNYLTNENPFF